MKSWSAADEDQLAKLRRYVSEYSGSGPDAAMIQVAALENKKAEFFAQEIKANDKVNRPSHYNAGTIEVIDAIEDWDLGFHAGNVIKYVARYKHKNGLEDLMKAQWYLNRLVEITEKEERCQKSQLN